MIDAIKKIGKEFSGEFLSGLIRFELLRYLEERRIEEPLLIKLIFSLDDKRVKSEILEIDRERLCEYYWVGRTFAASRAPISRLTTNSLEDFTATENKKRAFYNILHAIKDFWKEEIPSVVRELGDMLRKIEENFFKDKKEIERLHEKINEMIMPYKDKIFLYTACVEENGKIIELAKTEGYKKFLEHDFLHPHKLMEGCCHVCGERKRVLPDPAFKSGGILKIYVTDKKGFMSGVADTNEAKLRTFSICLDCLRELLIGENYINTNLKDKLGILNVYLIPKGIQLRKLNEMKECIRGVFGSVKGFEALQEFENKLQREQEYAKEYKELLAENICLDLIFGVPAQAKFDLKYYIQDVPILRLEVLRCEMKKITPKFKDLLGGSEEDWEMGFQRIREIFPLRTQQRKIREWKALLEFFSAMLTGTNYPKHLLIKRALMLAKIHRFGTYELYGMRRPKNPDDKLVKDLLSYNNLFKFLSNIKCMEIEKSEEEMDQEIPKEIKEYWNEIPGYKEKQKALFLLGYLVGRVGVEQYKRGDKRKAILNKINFDGMSSERVCTLANLILKSLRDYRILKSNESIYALMKFKLDKTIEEMKDSAENVFYILSGYAFSTRMAKIKGGGK